MNSKKASGAYNEALDLFVSYWGEMSSQWGINKTMAQIYALLYVENEAMDTDSIMQHLSISRGNANMNLRSLLEWGLVHKVNIKGMRKDFYTSEKDIWNMAAKIIDVRRKREISPIKDKLDQCSAVLEKAPEDCEDTAELKKKIENFQMFLKLFNDFSEAVLPYISEKNVDQIKGIVQMANMYRLQQESVTEIPEGGTNGKNG